MKANKGILEGKVQELLSVREQFPRNYMYRQGYELYYPPIFKTVISTISELNQSLAQLIATEVKFLTSIRRVVPVMILRSLIDCAMLLKAYLLYPNKEVFVNHYKKGSDINQLCVKTNGEKQRFTTNYLKVELEKDFSGIADLYKDCCEWVHPNYSDTKHAISAMVGIGRVGFRGKMYDQKIEDYSIEEIENGEVPEYDYEEECDIVDYAISINKLILALFKEIGQIYVPTEADINSVPYRL